MGQTIRPQAFGAASMVRVFNPSTIDLTAHIGALVERGPNGGRLYETATGTFEVYGAILEKYLEFGAENSLLGLPETNETGTPDGVGRFNHFQGGSIYWTPSTGAHVIYGAIRDRWASMGWETSYLGYPTSDELAFDEGGRVSVFQGGQVYWWADTGAIDLNDVIVHYTGLACFGETDWDMGSDSDEPYAVFAVATPTGTYATRTRVYDDVDSGEARPDLSEIYRGKPAGLVIDTVIIEHDEGDPEKYRREVEAAVGAAAAGITALVTLIPVVGPILAVGVGPGLTAATPKVAGELNRAFDFGDDKIGTGVVSLSPKAMVTLAARTANSEFKGIGFKVETPLISGEGASYKAYFGLVPG